MYTECLKLKVVIGWMLKNNFFCMNLVDIIEATAGPMGRWQLFITLLLFIGKFPISFVTVSLPTYI